jgi:hypothetical protein
MKINKSNGPHDGGTNWRFWRERKRSDGRNRNSGRRPDDGFSD